MVRNTIKQTVKKSGFGTAPVFFTSISTVLGAILFLRLGFATGTLGFWGALAMIIVGHLITIPTALAISELATNTRVEGGGEYFIISRSFGLKLGSTIGFTLYLSQTISIAFYTIAFVESFQPFFLWWQGYFGWELPRQAIGVPTLLILGGIFLKKGAGSGLTMLYIVNALLFGSLLFFFLGSPTEAAAGGAGTLSAAKNFGFFHSDQFFIIFAICFPAFTGMTAGVGLSGDLRNPGRSIPIGTMAGTLTGFIVYIFVIWKLSVSASPGELIEDQLIMSRIALYGALLIPLGLAASTSSSAIGSMLVAPRTLQAIAGDRTFPFRRLNIFLSRGKGESREPFNASIVTFLIALIFVLLGDVNSVAAVITMFFLITYGTLCLSSFLNHFGSPPSYRPRFRSKWYLSLGGFLLSVWVMFMINPLYTVVSYIVLVVIYLFLEHANKDRKGLVSIFKGALFQLNRRLQVYMQKHQANMETEEWRPASVCVSPHTFTRIKVLDVMEWISYQHGFGTYFHFIEGYYDRQTNAEAHRVLEEMVKVQRIKKSTLYLDTMISPSYTSAIAQVIQSPSISGMENNMVVFEYSKSEPSELQLLLPSVNLIKSGDFDVAILAYTPNEIDPQKGIHVWIKDTEDLNANFMILLGYIILSHPDWKKSHIRILLVSGGSDVANVKSELQERIAAGRLPITMNNIEIVLLGSDSVLPEIIAAHSAEAALVIASFDQAVIEGDPLGYFSLFDGVGDVLFVNTTIKKDIT